MAIRALSHPNYFPIISQWVVWCKYAPLFVLDDNFQKQSYRNRTYILGSNGKHRLSIPVKHSKNDSRQIYKDIKVDGNYWKITHWKTIKTAYRRSVYFEYYEDVFETFFQKKYTYLIDLNIESITLIGKCLNIDIDFEPAEIENRNLIDYRNISVAKRNDLLKLEPYIQVFADRFSFQNDLSIIDLLFNVGTDSLAYLKHQKEGL